MATTDGALARTVLDSLELAKIDFAVLHGEDRVASGVPTSDIDLAVDRPPSQVLAAVGDPLGKSGLRCVSACRYDLGATTLFFMSEDASDGVQIDLLWDPAGYGKYGFRTDVALGRRVRGARYAKLFEVDEFLYLLSKGLVKGDLSRTRRLLGELPVNPEGLKTAANRVLAPRVGRGVLGLLGEVRAGASQSQWPIQWIRSGGRYADRLIRPVGAWVDVYQGEPGAIRATAARFGRVLVASVASERPRKRLDQFWWWAQTVAPVRWRPGLVVSCGAGDPVIRPDGELTGPMSEVALARAIVGVMAARVEARLDRRLASVGKRIR